MFSFERSCGFGVRVFGVRCGEMVVLRDERDVELTRRTCAEISEAGGGLCVAVL